jgi:putative flippase GtrA
VKTTTQFFLFLAVGGVQVVVDASLFAVIFIIAGEPLVGNVISRATAAAVGFALNRRYTFDAWRPGEAGRQVLRYILLWLVLTVLSTSLVGAANAVLGEVPHGREWLVVVKILIEAVLALLSYLAMRYGVFRADKMLERRKTGEK